MGGVVGVWKIFRYPVSCFRVFLPVKRSSSFDLWRFFEPLFHYLSPQLCWIAFRTVCRCQGYKSCTFCLRVVCIFRAKHNLKIIPEMNLKICSPRGQRWLKLVWQRRKKHLWILLMRRAKTIYSSLRSHFNFGLFLRSKNLKNKFE